MKYYPVFLDISNRPCTVVGGGLVAERKVWRLLISGALVTVVSPCLTPTLEALEREGKIKVHRSEYDSAYIKGAFLVIGATDRPDVNERIFQDGRKAGILVNIVDDPERCDFILPSVMEQGDLTIAVSTAGKSPALARKIRQDLAEIFGPEYARLTEILGRIREENRGKEPDGEKRTEMYSRLVSSEILKEIREKRWDRVKEIIREHTGLEIDLNEGETR
jgi:precorrin-2 dehydrogenase/sirohydrochlorin ferrochelatase